MIISSGLYKGMKIKTLDSLGTRPTAIKVRQAVFNSIQYLIENSSFLDLFAGSGAVGIEALSRGAESSTFIELDRGAYSVLETNLKEVRRRNPEVIYYSYRDKVENFLERASNKVYDFIWADPPYKDCCSFYDRFNGNILDLLKDKDSYFIMELAKKDLKEITDINGSLELIKVKEYGISAVRFWRKK